MVLRKEDKISEEHIYWAEIYDEGKNKNKKQNQPGLCILLLNSSL